MVLSHILCGLILQANLGSYHYAHAYIDTIIWYGFSTISGCVCHQLEIKYNGTFIVIRSAI